MDQYKEVTTRHRIQAGQEFQSGQTMRTVSLSEKDAKILNGMESDHGVKYVKIESTPEEPTEKEVRSELFSKAEAMGLTPPKNISTEKLKELIKN